MRGSLSAYLDLPASRAVALAGFLALGFLMYCSNAAMVGG